MDFESTIRDGKCLDVARAGSLSPLGIFFFFLDMEFCWPLIRSMGLGNKGVKGGGYMYMNVYEVSRV